MVTSAHALYELFVKVTNDSPGDQFFPAAVADKLDLVGDDREGRAVTFVQKMLKNTQRDIEELPFDDLRKQELRNRIARFSGYIDFSHCHLDVGNSRRNQLNAENLVGLTIVDMALSGKREITALDRSTIELASQFRDLREEVQAANLPLELKEAVITRLNQIAAALDHFAFYGRSGFNDAVFALTGAIVLHRNAVKKSSTSFWLKLGNLLSKAAAGVNTAHKTAAGVQGTLEAGADVYETITNLLGP